MQRVRKSIHFLFILLVLAHLQACKSLNTQVNRVTIELRADGAILLDGKKTALEDMKEALTEKTKTAPREKCVSSLEMSLLEVLIKTEGDVRYEAVADALDTCAKLNIRRTYFSHPDVDNGREVELWLPVDGHIEIVSEPLIEKPIIILEEEEEKEQKKERKQDEKVEKEQQGAVPEKEKENPLIGNQEFSSVLSELRVKLFWVDRNNTGKRLSAKEDPEGNVGMVSLKFQDTLYMEGNQPNWKRFEEEMRSIAGSYKPSKHFQKRPIIIDAMKKVHFADVLRCVVICRKAGMGEITLAVRLE